jgi:MFS family permease
VTCITQAQPEGARRLGTFAGLSPLVLIIGCGFTAIAMPLPILSGEVHDNLGFSVATAGWVIGAQSIATVLSRHLAGLLADSRGAKIAVLTGLPLASAAGLAYVAAAFLPLPPEIALAILLAGRLVLGVAESLFLTGSMSWGIGRMGPERTGKVMAWQGIAIYGAIGIGAPIGLWVEHVLGFGGVALATIALPLFAMLAALSTRAVPPVAVERAPFHRVLALIWRPGLVLAFATAPYAAMASFLAVDYAARGWQGAGLALSAFAVCFILVRVFFAHLPDKIGGLTVACASLIIEGIGQILIFAAPSAPLALCGSALSGIGFSLVFPAMGVLATRRVAPAQRGRAVGNYISFFDMALGLTAPAAGLLGAQWGYASIFLAGGCSVALALLALLGVARMRVG